MEENDKRMLTVLTEATAAFEARLMQDALFVIGQVSCESLEKVIMASMRFRISAIASKLQGMAEKLIAEEMERARRSAPTGEMEVVGDGLCPVRGREEGS